eukprot:3382812-Rhodomonas_salina.1
MPGTDVGYGATRVRRGPGKRRSFWRSRRGWTARWVRAVPTHGACAVGCYALANAMPGTECCYGATRVVLNAQYCLGYGGKTSSTEAGYGGTQTLLGTYICAETPG